MGLVEMEWIGLDRIELSWAELKWAGRSDSIHAIAIPSYLVSHSPLFFVCCFRWWCWEKKRKFFFSLVLIALLRESFEPSVVDSKQFLAHELSKDSRHAWLVLLFKAINCGLMIRSTKVLIEFCCFPIVLAGRPALHCQHSFARFESVISASLERKVFKVCMMSKLTNDFNELS